MSRWDAKIEIEEITDGDAIVTTKDLYRVIFHGPNVNTDIYHPREFLTAKDAIQTAEIHNSLELYIHDGDLRKCSCFAEVCSYGETEERWEKREREDDIAERVADRLEERDDERRERSRYRRAIKRTRAFWRWLRPGVKA